MPPSIGAGYLQDIAGIPAEYTNVLENLGYMNTPFQNTDQAFLSMEGFQRALKSILDRQLQAYGNNAPNGNLNYLPLNLRNIYSTAAPALTDPRYGIIGAPGMFANGYSTGNLPGGHSAAYQMLLDQRNAPTVPPPNISNNSGGGGSGGGGGSSRSNIAPPDIGTHQGVDASGNIVTINKAYGNMSEDEKDAANRFGRAHPNGM